MDKGVYVFIFVLLIGLAIVFSTQQGTAFHDLEPCFVACTDPGCPAPELHCLLCAGAPPCAVAESLCDAITSTLLALCEAGAFCPGGTTPECSTFGSFQCIELLMCNAIGICEGVAVQCIGDPGCQGPDCCYGDDCCEGPDCCTGPDCCYGDDCCEGPDCECMGDDCPPPTCNGPGESYCPATDSCCGDNDLCLSGGCCPQERIYVEPGLCDDNVTECTHHLDCEGIGSGLCNNYSLACCPGGSVMCNGQCCGAGEVCQGDQFSEPQCVPGGPGFCGDFNIDPGEQCDDGGRCTGVGEEEFACVSDDQCAGFCLPTSGDGCDNFCIAEICGNGISGQLMPPDIDGDGFNDIIEECDDANSNNNDSCIIDLAPLCEDRSPCMDHADCTGIGNELCLPQVIYGCKDATCGDGYLWTENCGPGECETADDGVSCVLAVCGDDIIQSEIGETCEISDDSACPGLCIPPGEAGECTCGLPPAGGFLNLEWHNLINQEINESYVNDTVRLVAETSFSDDSMILFEIYDNDFPLIDDPIRAGPDALSNTTTNGIATYDWKITDQDMETASGDEITSIIEFYFTAQETITTITNDSREFDDGIYDGHLYVNDSEGPSQPPTANITGPEHRQVYFNGTLLEFNHSSFDIDSPIETVEWIIEQNGEIVNQSTEEQVLHTFAEPGQATATLRVTDNDGLTDEDQIAILIIASPGMLLYINEPEHLQVIPDPRGNLCTEHEVNYSATDSYVINSTETGPCTRDIECLAGDCPPITFGAPAGCVDPIAIQNHDQPFDALSFNWTFSDELNSDVNFSFFIENGVNGTTYYAYRSDLQGDKQIELYASGPDVEETTTRSFTLGQCISNGEQYIFLNGDGSIDQIADTSEGGVCAGQDGVIGVSGGILDDCCPFGTICTDDNGIARCSLSSDFATTCADYDNEEECNYDRDRIGQPPGYNGNYDPLYDVADLNCGEIVDGNVVQCGCSWDAIEGECLFRKRYAGCSQLCVVETQPAECVNGWITYNTTQRLIQEPTCTTCTEEIDCGEDIIVQVPCGRVNFELTFFDYRQGIAVAIIIILLYFVITYFQKKQSKHRRKHPKKRN